MSYMLNGFECITLDFVWLSGPAHQCTSYHMCHQRHVYTCIHEHWQKLFHFDCSHLPYLRRFKRKWYGIQWWDLRFPTVATPHIICSPASRWLMVKSSRRCTFLRDRVSLLSFWLILLSLRQKDHQWHRSHHICLNSQLLTLKTWKSPQSLPEC